MLHLILRTGTLESVCGALSRAASCIVGLGDRRETEGPVAVKGLPDVAEAGGRAVAVRILPGFLKPNSAGLFQNP